jgi:hypothetical protein
MKTIKAIRLASLVTAINVLVAYGFSIAAIIRPQYLVPAESVRTQASLLLAMYAAARTIPLALLKRKGRESLALGRSRLLLRISRRTPFFVRSLNSVGL